MKKIILLFVMSLGFTWMAYGQSISDTELIKIAVAEKQKGTSESDIAAKLLQRGATIDQIKRIRSQYASQITQRGLDSNVDNAIGNVQDRMRTNNEVSDNAITTHEGANAPQVVPEALSPSGKRVFGRDIFNNRSLTFEPQMNIATPQNYVLGPGDQLIIDVYGDTQKSEQLTVSPDGDVTIPGYGPVHVSGLSVASAQSRVRSSLGTYYQSSDIKVTVGQTRTIQVNVMGEVRAPGTYTLSAFATVFHALYRAGGISSLGTLRSIKVFRQGRQISVVDVYEFILNGRLAGNVRLQDNDVIQVGPYESIVDISGRVKRPMAYELRKDESLATLLKYSGGFANDAYRKSLRVLRNNGRMKSVFNVSEFDMSEFKMEDGDVVSVDTMINRYENMVEVKGAVFRDGMYQLGDRVNSVRTLIESADGLKEEAMTSRAVLRRMKPNRTQEVLSIDLAGILSGTSPDVPLQNEDILFIPTMAEHQNLRTLEITGEVVFPGTFEYADGMTIEDLILQAGGLTDAASAVKIDVARRLRDPKATTSTMEIAKTFSFSMKDGYMVDGDRSFTLEPYDIVQVRRSPVFQAPIRVTVGGEVAFRGVYVMDQKNQRLSDVIRAAGGVVPGAYVRGARLIRNMSEDELARKNELVEMARQSASMNSNDSLALDQLALQNTYSVGIHLDEALAHPGCDEDVELQDGDQLVIPRMNHTIRISGDVLKPNTVAFKDRKDYKYYVEQAGGYGKRARKSHTYVLYMNGTIAKASKADIEPGCEVIVPTKGPKEPANVTQWLGIGTSAASLATMFISIANMLK
jgi:protein involved in polysaccharide export with SLBB domain